MPLSGQHIASVNATTNTSVFVTTSATVPADSLIIGFVHNPRGTTPPLAPVLSGLDGIIADEIATSTFNIVNTPLNRITAFRAWVPTEVTGPFTGRFASSQVGCSIQIYQFTGVFNGAIDNGASCIRHVVSGAADATENPNLTFVSGLAPGSRNAIVFAFGNDTNPFGGTVETDWVEDADVGFNNPACGTFVGHRAETIDNSVIVTKAASNWGGIALEIKSKTQDYQIDQHGKSRIQKTSNNTIQGIANIIPNEAQIDVSWVRFEAPEGSESSETTNTSAITGRTRIEKSSTTSENGQSRIEKSNNSNEDGLSRIQKQNTETEIGRSRIEISNSNNESGRSLIQKLLNSITTGQGRIESQNSENIAGISNISGDENTLTRAINGKAAILKSLDSSEAGQSRIQNIFSSQISAISRTQKQQTNQQTGLSRIVSSKSEAITGLCRININNSSNLTGRARLNIHLRNSITGLTKIERESLIFVDGALKLKADDGNWYLISVVVIDENARELFVDQSATTASNQNRGYAILTASDGLNYKISLVDEGDGIAFDVNQTATTEDSDGSQIPLIGDDDNFYNLKLVESNGNVEYSLTPADFDETITGKSSIRNQVRNSESGQSRIQKIFNNTETGISRINKLLNSVINGLSRTQKQRVSDISGVSSIHVDGAFLNHDETISGLSSIRKSLTYNVNGQSRIQGDNRNNENGIARIQKITPQTCQGHSRVQISSSSQLSGQSTITTASDNSTTTEITGQSRILNSVRETESGVSRIQKTLNNLILGQSFVQKNNINNETGISTIKNQVIATIGGICRIGTVIGTERAIFIHMKSNKHISTTNIRNKASIITT